MKTLITALVAITLVMCVASSAFAIQKYNPFSNRFETTSEDSELEYNVFENSFSYN